MAGCKNQLNMKYHSKRLVFKIVTLKSLFALENYHCKHFGRNFPSRNINNNQHIQGFN